MSAIRNSEQLVRSAELVSQYAISQQSAVPLVRSPKFSLPSRLPPPASPLAPIVFPIQPGIRGFYASRLLFGPAACRDRADLVQGQSTERDFPAGRRRWRFSKWLDRKNRAGKGVARPGS